MQTSRLHIPMHNLIQIAAVIIIDPIVPGLDSAGFNVMFDTSWSVD